MHISVDTCSTGAPAEPALRRPGGRLSFGLHHAHTRVPEAPPVSGSFCRQAEEAGIGERARETITVGGSSPQAYVTDRPRRAPQPSRPIVLLGDVMLHPRILKFGGTSVADAAAVERVTGVVRSHGGPRPVVVVSALAGVTDALLTAADAAADGDPRATAPSLDALLERHARLPPHPPPPGGRKTPRLEAGRREIERLLDLVEQEPDRRAALRDEIASYGERLSASLLAAALTGAGIAARYVDSRHCLTTDATHGRANPLLTVTIERTRAALTPLLEDGLVPVLGGYIAATADGITTTLGRGGADHSPAPVGGGAGPPETPTRASCRARAPSPAYRTPRPRSSRISGPRCCIPRRFSPRWSVTSRSASATRARPATRARSSPPRERCPPGV